MNDYFVQDEDFCCKTPCAKCKKDLSKIKAEKGIKYEGIDFHHNPPQFMFENKNDWKGNIICLCRDCHIRLHNEIRKIMFDHSNLFKPNKSDYWTWIKVIGDEKIKCREEVFKFTMRWLDGD